MIEIVQAGQAGKTSLLFDMHRLRTRVFREKLGWDVAVNDDGLEVDAFDIPEAIYLLALNGDGRVIGSWRLLSTTGPTMIRDVWPQYMESLPMPADDNVWEVSRFSVDSLHKDPDIAARENQETVGKMFCALTELCLATGIREIYTLYDGRIAKVIQRLDCHPVRTSAQILIDGSPCQTGVFRTDADMLERLQNAAGIRESLIDGIALPERIKKKQGTGP